MVQNTATTEDFPRTRGKIDNQRIETLEEAYRSLLEAIGEDPERQGLRRTPIRAAQALDFLTQG